MRIVLIDTSMCTGCGDCLTACPFEAIFRNPSLDRILKCDLCGGQPQCVRFCTSGALEIRSAETGDQG